MPTDLIAQTQSTVAAALHGVRRAASLTAQRLGLTAPLHQVVVVGGRIVHVEHPPGCPGPDLCPVGAAARRVVEPLASGIWHVDVTAAGMLTVDSQAVPRGR